MIEINNMKGFFNLENSHNINKATNITNTIPILNKDINCSNIKKCINDIYNPGLVPIEIEINSNIINYDIIDTNNYIIKKNLKAKAILFGLNYDYLIDGKLNGCINDVIFMGNYIQNILNIDTQIFTDENSNTEVFDNTSYDGFMINLYKLAIESHIENLDFVWIHYSGHGSNIFNEYTHKMRQGLLPSDGKYKGLLFDNIINIIFSSFNPNTRILFVCDACHSGTIADLNYSWDENKNKILKYPNSKILSKMICISGCLDYQTSADSYNLLNNNKPIGALTACIITILNNNPRSIHNIFKFVSDIRIKLKSLNFTQYPELSSSYDLTNDISILPLETFITPKESNTNDVIKDIIKDVINTHIKPDIIDVIKTPINIVEPDIKPPTNQIEPFANQQQQVQQQIHQQVVQQPPPQYCYQYPYQYRYGYRYR